MKLQIFFTEKSNQLDYYVTRYLRGQLAQREMHLFIWDTLEEWAQLEVRNKMPNDVFEQVFWHLLYQLEYWSEQEIRRNRKLRRELQRCSNFLRGKAQAPAALVGIRP